MKIATKKIERERVNKQRLKHMFEIKVVVKIHSKNPFV